ncbi:MAG: hypothetical protein OXH01_05645 [Bacteroidetes bacterium]|nr:hypothetical protein [Bacteroidota bacterium]
MDQVSLGYLEQFSRQKFNSTKLRALALKLSRGEKIYAFLKEQLTSPSDKFANFISKMIFDTTKRVIRDDVKKSLPSVFSRLIDTKTKPPIIVTPDDDEEQNPVVTPSEEQDPFEISVTHTKLEYFRYQDKIVHGTWTDMFVHVFEILCKLDSPKLLSTFAGVKSFKITHDQKLIKRECKSIGNGLFIQTAYSTADKIQYLRTAFESFNMRDTLRVKFGRNKNVALDSIRLSQSIGLPATGVRLTHAMRGVARVNIAIENYTSFPCSTTIRI